MTGTEIACYLQLLLLIIIILTKYSSNPLFPLNISISPDAHRNPYAIRICILRLLVITSRQDIWIRGLSLKTEGDTEPDDKYIKNWETVEDHRQSSKPWEATAHLGKQRYETCREVLTAPCPFVQLNHKVSQRRNEYMVRVALCTCLWEKWDLKRVGWMAQGQTVTFIWHRCKWQP